MPRKTRKTKAPPKKFTIELNEEQMRVMEDALNIYSRLGLGQLCIVAEFLDTAFYDKCKEKGINHWDMRQLWTDVWAKTIFGFSPGASYGIGHPEVPERCTVAYEMQKCIQNELSKDQTEYSVWKNKPLKYSSEPLITVTEVE